jgi:hypothetical protein
MQLLLRRTLVLHIFTQLFQTQKPLNTMNKAILYTHQEHTNLNNINHHKQLVVCN